MTRKRITFVQVGNYAEAYERFRAGGGEDFFAQRYSVDFVAALAGRADVEQITQLCISAKVPEQRLDDGIRQIGLVYRGPDGRARTRELCDLVFASKPTHLIVDSPITALIRKARKAGIDVFPLLADSFRVPGIKARIRYALLAHELKHPAIRVVTNRNLNASRDLERIGVPPGKIVPFDWPPVVKPSDFPVKTKAADPAAPRLVYVGQVRVEKGVGDLVDAVAAEVVCAGKLIHPEVLRTMHDGEVVLVPRRHEYPEGMHT